MKHIKLLALSVLILALALLFQSKLNDGNSPDRESRAPFSTAHITSPVTSLSTPVGAAGTEASVAPATAVGYGHLKTRASHKVVKSDQIDPRADPVELADASHRLSGSTRLSLFATPSATASLPWLTHIGAIEPTPTPAMPLVVAYQPSTNALLKDLHTSLVFTFDHRPSSAEHALVVAPSVTGQISWRNDRTMVFVPDPGWAPDTRYDVQLGAGFHSSFRTNPVVKHVYPAQAESISRYTKFAFQFGVQVDRASVERAFSITPTVEGRLRWTDDLRVVFEAGTPLDYVTTYRIGFGGDLLDAEGEPLPPVPAWSFTTRSALVSARPQGTVSVDSPIELEFDTPMDQVSVESAVVVTANSSTASPTEALSGSFQWQDDKLVFTPNDYWDPDTTYNVVLRTTARNADGRPVIADDYVWQFTTASLPRTVDFGYGPNVQVLDAGGRRAVQLMSYADAAHPATLRLYALSVPQFLDRYASSFRGIGPSEDRPIRTSDLPVVANWERDLERRDEVFLPDELAPGLYVLEAQSGPGSDQLIVVLTRHALVVKQAERQLVTWASTMADHTPAAGMRLSFYDRNGTVVAEGVTEERGLHRIVVPVDTEPLIVIGELDGDITVSGLGNEWQQGWGWWGWWQTNPGAPDATIYPYTDRPIYRPGQTVHTRAVIRRDDDALYSVPEGDQVLVRLRDARDNVVASRRLTPDAFGAVYADFEIADGGTVGTYNLEVSALGVTTRQPFLVEAYRKPDYEVALIPATEHVVSGEPLTVTVQANYFFGAPVVDAKVELVPYVVGYDDWYQGAAALDYGYAYEKLRQVGCTDAAGRLTIVLPAAVTNNSDRQTWNIEATVTDASDLSISGHARVLVHRAAFGLSLYTERYHFRPGEPIPVTLLASAVEPQATAQPGVPLSVGLYAWDRQTKDYSQSIVEGMATIDASGRAEVVLQTTRSGWYQMRAVGTDRAGREVQAERWVLVYDVANDLWDAGLGGDLHLSTDRDRYAPGDSVSLLIESPVSGPALLSFERGTTRRETVFQLAEGLNTLSFALLPDDVPNVHVAVAVWRPTEDDERWQWQSRPDEELLTARTEILVPADDQRLAVTITPDQDEYSPRDEAVFLVQIHDAAGQPVQAGFSLALVDEAIFSLAADQTPHIFDAFYQPRPDVVRTFHSLRPFRWLDWGMGGGGGGAALGGSPRSDFPDTAFWGAALTTDEDGNAWVRVALPDSLTSWRAVVRAVTADTKVGQATADIAVALPLSIEPVLPRFLVQGDRVALTAVVHNYTGQTRLANVALTGGGFVLDSSLSATQQITLPAGGTVTVGWRVLATEIGRARVRMDVALEGEGTEPWTDGVVLSVPVAPRAVPDVTTVATEVKSGWVDTIELPDGAIPDITRWQLSLTPSIATGMLDGLEYLIDYPFG